MLVAIAASEMLVRTDTAVAMPMMIKPFRNPALPTENPSRRNRMIPRIVRIDGVKTPANVPSVPVRARWSPAAAIVGGS